MASPHRLRRKSCKGHKIRRVQVPGRSIVIQVRDPMPCPHRPRQCIREITLEEGDIIEE
jgi:hypothetical protein